MTHFHCRLLRKHPLIRNSAFFQKAGVTVAIITMVNRNIMLINEFLMRLYIMQYHTHHMYSKMHNIPLDLR